MRLLFLIHELARNGAVIALLEQVRYLRDKGHAVSIVASELEGAAAALRPRFEAEGARVLDTVAAGEYDAAIGCTVFAAERLEPLLGKVPVAFWIHEGMAGVSRVLSHAAAARVLQQANKLVFPSRPVAERLFAPLLTNVPPERIEIIPGIVPPPPPGPAAAKPAGTLRVLCVGSIYPRKRQIDLLRAVAMIRGAPVECVLAGEIVHLEPEMRELVEARPDRFLLTGGLDPEAIAALYRSADVFSLPSSDECMPIAPVEAAWHGVPVVLSDLPAYAGPWRDGHNALLHPVGDVEMLAWHLRTALESAALRARLITQARLTARGFSAERNGALFEAMLLEMLGSQPERPRPVPPHPTAEAASGNPPGSLTALANRHRSDKGTAYGSPPHRYTMLYDLLFFELRQRPITLLELGLAIGGPELGGPVERRVNSPSVAMWLEYFPQAQIVGFDISDFSHLEHPRFRFVRGDAGVEADLRRAAATSEAFDVILDDGSHASFHQQLAFRTLFPKLASGGLYIIEDLHWQSPFYEGTLPAVPQTAEFLSRFLMYDSYVENPLMPRERMGEFADGVASFAIFPDFTRGSGSKLIVIRAK